MKKSVLASFLMVMFAFSVVQPIFGEPNLGDTRITSKYGPYLEDTIVPAGKNIELQAKMWRYRGYYDYEDHNRILKTYWIEERCRYLEFYVYKANEDGSNGKLVWSDSAMTNFFTANANPDKFILTEKGSYNLIVKYEGKIKHCISKAKIYVT